jgi:hypothetical protein
MYGRSVKKVPYNQKECLPSPTYNYASHQKWAQRYVWALVASEKDNPFTKFATIFLGKPRSSLVSKFTTSFNKSISNKNYRQKLNQSYFGVFEFTDNQILHVHLIIRNIPNEQIEGFLKGFNNKNSVRFSLPYYEDPEAPKAAITYSLKLGKPEKNLFFSGTLNRYTMQGGNYFDSKIAFYSNEGRKEYFANLN